MIVDQWEVLILSEVPMVASLFCWAVWLYSNLGRSTMGENWGTETEAASPHLLPLVPPEQTTWPAGEMPTASLNIPTLTISYQMPLGNDHGWLVTLVWYLCNSF